MKNNEVRESRQERVERLLKGYRVTKWMKLLEEFIESDMECASISYEEGEYSKPGACHNSAKNAIKRFGCEGTVGAKTVDGKVYLYRKDKA